MEKGFEQNVMKGRYDVKNVYSDWSSLYLKPKLHMQFAAIICTPTADDVGFDDGDGVVYSPP